MSILFQSWRMSHSKKNQPQSLEKQYGYACYQKCLSLFLAEDVVSTVTYVVMCSIRLVLS